MKTGIEIKHRDCGGNEYGYGIYIHADAPDNPKEEWLVSYAWECLPFGASDESIARAERRVYSRAYRQLRKQRGEV